MKVKQLKELLSTHFKLGLDPKKEYFLFGNDQIRARYDENFTPPSIRNNQEITKGVLNNPTTNETDTILPNDLKECK